jgi:hypothetical protein
MQIGKLFSIIFRPRHQKSCEKNREDLDEIDEEEGDEEEEES